MQILVQLPGITFFLKKKTILVGQIGTVTYDVAKVTDEFLKQLAINKYKINVY